jgi:hypothetical protein
VDARHRDPRGIARGAASRTHLKVDVSDNHDASQVDL